MYIPNHFRIDDVAEIRRFIDANSFGQIVSQCEGKLFSTHAPILLSADALSVSVHLARSNPQHLDIAGQEVLITLEGAHGYISPGWYTSPGVPTWNYQAVHIYGVASICEEAEYLAAHVEALAAKYESASEEPWVPSYRREMLSGIIGLEIAVTDIQCKYKLSQNRPVDERPQIVEQLQKSGQDALAIAMHYRGH
jgi:transcriptional regulator